MTAAVQPCSEHTGSASTPTTQRYGILVLITWVCAILDAGRRLWLQHTSPAPQHPGSSLSFQNDLPGSTRSHISLFRLCPIDNSTTHLHREQRGPRKSWSWVCHAGHEPVEQSAVGPVIRIMAARAERVNMYTIRRRVRTPPTKRFSWSLSAKPHGLRSSSDRKSSQTICSGTVPLTGPRARRACVPAMRPCPRRSATGYSRVPGGNTPAGRRRHPPRPG